MKLSYKIFAVYLLVSFILLFSVFATIKIYATRHFKEVEVMIEKETFTILTYELALEYQKKGNWNQFKTDQDAFDHFIKRMVPPPLPPLPPDFKPPPDFSGRKFFIPRQQICLYSADRIKIAGPHIDKPHLSFEPILINEIPVGWIGYGKIRPLPPPMSLSFLKTRLKVFYTIGIILFLIAGGVSYLLSRHILSPVNKLTQGTKALTRFKFNTRIQVSTKDELGQLAKDFNQMASTLEGYEAMRRQWMMDISHELRTPLSILKGEIEALQDGVRTISPSRIDSLHAEILCLETLVNDLHLLSMADTDALALRTQPARPIAILRSVLDIFSTRLKQEHLTLNATFENLDLTLSADEDRLRHLFSNIIENNIKYTRKPGTIIVWNKIEKHTLIIRIEDSGPGVPPVCLEKIFDRLYRLDSSRNRKQGGSGLGLSICKTIASAHGGDITATLTKKGGLRITIQLPMA